MIITNSWLSWSESFSFISSVEKTESYQCIFSFSNENSQGLWGLHSINLWTLWQKWKSLKMTVSSWCLFFFRQCCLISVPRRLVLLSFIVKDWVLEIVTYFIVIEKYESCHQPSMCTHCCLEQSQVQKQC